VRREGGRGAYADEGDVLDGGHGGGVGVGSEDCEVREESLSG
jgi:hypothetical protein